jgi:hypothetical protein
MGYCVEHRRPARDPSLRLKYGSAQDDAHSGFSIVCKRLRIAGLTRSANSAISVVKLFRSVFIRVNPRKMKFRFCVAPCPAKSPLPRHAPQVCSDSGGTLSLP